MIAMDEHDIDDDIEPMDDGWGHEIVQWSQFDTREEDRGER